MSNHNYTPGSHKVLCDICSRTKKREEVRKTWDGFLACVGRCWYPKHPNDNPRKIVIDGYPVQDARPRPAIANFGTIELGGVTRWSDTGLRWDTPYWRWLDDPENGSIVPGVVLP